MTSHELARKLLDGPDLTVVVADPHDDLAGQGTVLNVRVGKYRVNDGKRPTEGVNGSEQHVAWVKSLKVVDCILI